MNKLKGFIYPNSIDEAVDIIKHSDSKVEPIAGGTSLARNINPRVEWLMDITTIGLNYISRRDKHTCIGATCRATDIDKSELLLEVGDGFLNRAASRVGSPPIRNMATIGGNIMQTYPWSDLPLPLMCLGAKCLFLGPEEKIIDLEQLYKPHPRKVIGRDYLLKEIYFETPSLERIGSYQTFIRTEVDYAMVSVACQAFIKDGKFKNVTITVGAYHPIPFRVRVIEKMLEGLPANKKSVTEASHLFKENYQPTTDNRCTLTYKQEIASVLLERGLLDCRG